ncbi:MAG TPA: 4-alpha-glucanotransferase, partial [Egibacteraceae bacterium]|nr:4-alpha-glucanotransferase [Egibacteraceae bacterium]
VVPKGFRPLMAERSIHAYKVFFFEREEDDFADPAGWPRNALACLATHDTPTFTGWWRGSDLTLRRTLGMLSEEEEAAERATRAEERAAVAELSAGAETEVEVSARLHAHIAESPCRLAALQIEDALGIEAQVNVPGTIDEHPNWRSRLPVAVDVMAEHSGFRAHVAAMRAVRPR